MFDVAVIGGGPAGIAAATRASESGARTVLLDEAPRPGGQIWRHCAGGSASDAGDTDAPPIARRWIDRLHASGAGCFAGATVFDLDATGVVYAARGDEPLEIRARRIVLATGARERFLPFPGWTLPNVMGVAGVQAFAKAGASFRGKRVALSGSGPLLFPVADTLRHAGAEIVLLAEQAPWSSLVRFALTMARYPKQRDEALRYALRLRGTPLCAGSWVISASGDGQLREVEWTDGRRRRRLMVDVLGASFGLVPNLELAQLVGAEIENGFVSVDETQQTSIPGIYCAGEPTGIGGVDLALVEGEIAGLAAAGTWSKDRHAALLRKRTAGRALVQLLAHHFALRPELRNLPTAETIVCRCEDVPLSRLDASWQARTAKLYTRAGMGRCQGRVCGPAFEFLFGWQTGVVRAPSHPVPVAAMVRPEESA